LAAFSATGAEVGFIQGYSDNALIIVIAGMITGVGGGIMRDILIDTTPYVFKKHIYALASVFGSLLYYFLRQFLDNISLASALAMLSVIIIRILATKYCWSLPKVSIAMSNELTIKISISTSNRTMRLSYSTRRTPVIPKRILLTNLLISSSI